MSNLAILEVTTRLRNIIIVRIIATTTSHILFDMIPKYFYLLFIIFLALHSSTSESKEISTNSFDVNIEKIPKSYKGTNISELYSMLSKKVPIKKSEFISSIEHEKKITELISDNILAIKLDPTDFNYTGGLHVKPYNADKELLQINIRTVALRKVCTTQDFECHRFVATQIFGI